MGMVLERDGVLRPAALGELALLVQHGKVPLVGVVVVALLLQHGEVGQHGEVLVQHGKKLGHHGEVLGQHDEVLGHHGEVLGHHGEVLGQHGVVLGQHGVVLGQHGEVPVQQEEVLGQHAEMLGQQRQHDQLLFSPDGVCKQVLCVGLDGEVLVLEEGGAGLLAGGPGHGHHGTPGVGEH